MGEDAALCKGSLYAWCSMRDAEHDSRHLELGGHEAEKKLSDRAWESETQ